MAMIVKNNTPLAGYIEWSDVSISYKGQVYKITNGNTNYPYIFWKYSDPLVFYGSFTFPDLGNDDLLVFLNKNGTHIKVPTATVVDGSLIVPESIIADALAANSVTGEKIRAGEINAEHIQAGSISVDLLASGVNPNIVGNGYDTFAQIPIGANDIVKASGTSASITTSSLGFTSGKVLQVTDATCYLAKDANDFSITVTAGRTYIISAYVRNDTTSTTNNQTLGLRFNNTARDVYGSAIPVLGNSGWKRISVAVTVPVSVTKAMLYVGSVKAYLWDAFMVEEITPYQTEASAWKPSGTTVIWGGNIGTRSINSDKIATKSLTADEIAAGAIGANEIAANAIIADKIAANAVTAGKIAIGDFTNLATVNEVLGATTNDYSSGATIISNGYVKKKSSTQQYLMLCEYTANPFKQNDEIYYEFEAFSPSTTKTCTITVLTYDANKTLISSNTTSSITLTASNAKYTGSLKLAHSSFNTAAYILIGFGSVGSNDLSVRRVFVRKKSGGELIVDGSLTADKIRTGTLDATNMTLKNLNIGNGNFVVDANGNVTFRGTLDGATGSFYGSLTSANIILTSGDTSNAAIGIAAYGWGDRVGGGTILKDYGLVNIGQNSDLTVVRDKPVIEIKNNQGRSIDLEVYGSIKLSDTKIDTYALNFDASIQEKQIMWNPGQGGNIGFYGGPYGTGQVGMFDFGQSRSIWWYSRSQNSFGFDINSVSAHALYADNWFRSVGQSGWVSETYGGGWYMTDINTVRCYNNKNVYTTGYFQANRFQSTDGWFRAYDSSNREVLAAKIIDTTYRHKFISGDYTAIKLLNSGTLQVQFRNAADTDYIDVVGKVYTNGSKREMKKNIQAYTKNATSRIVSTPIRNYNFKNELDEEFPHLGIIYDESPVEVVDLRGEGVDAYAMTALSWKAIQELHERITILESERG